MFHVAIAWYVTILKLQKYVCVGYYTLVDKIIYCCSYVKWLSVWYVPCKEVLNCISDHILKLAILHLYIGS
jgi:hypothetical protein